MPDLKELFAGYSPEDRKSIQEQLLALKQSGKLNPAQNKSVGNALVAIEPETDPKVSAIHRGQLGEFWDRTLRALNIRPRRYEDEQHPTTIGNKGKGTIVDQEAPLFSLPEYLGPGQLD